MAKPDETLQPRDVMIATEPLELRLAPAMKILKDLMAKAEEKRKVEAQNQAHEQALQFESQNAQVVDSLQGDYFVTMDGDGIGNQVARAQFTNEIEKVKEVSRRIDSGKDAFVAWSQRFGGQVVEVGGDEGQVKVAAAALEYIEEFRNEYKKVVGATVTVGVGRTISESIQARELGKLRGKNQVCIFDEGTVRELTLRMQQKGPDSPEKKLEESGVLAPAGSQETPKYGQEPSQYGLPKGKFDENKQKQQDYEKWLATMQAPRSSIV